MDEILICLLRIIISENWSNVAKPSKTLLLSCLNFSLFSSLINILFFPFLWLCVFVQIIKLWWRCGRFLSGQTNWFCHFKTCKEWWSLLINIRMAEDQRRLSGPPVSHESVHQREERRESGLFCIWSTEKGLGCSGASER